MLKRLNKSNKGFTIIEVLIVLAIAGLILLIVFLAVPALQRNSRNTATKNDVGNVLSGVAEYQAANAGALPTTVAGTGTINYGAGNATTASVQGTTVVSVTAGNPPSVGLIYVHLGVKCDGTANTRAVSAAYKLERTGAPIDMCQDG